MYRMKGIGQSASLMWLLYLYLSQPGTSSSKFKRDQLYSQATTSMVIMVYEHDEYRDP